MSQERFEFFRRHLEGLRPLHVIASEASIPYRPAFGWVSGYRKRGLAKAGPIGKRRPASTQLIQAIQGLALEQATAADQFHTPASQRDGRGPAGAQAQL